MIKIGKFVFDEVLEEKVIELYNEGHTIKHILLKLGLSRYEYSLVFRKVRDEGRVVARKHRQKKPKRVIKNYTYNVHNDSYLIRKNGRHYAYAKTEEEAKRLVELFKENDWDYSTRDEIKKIVMMEGYNRVMIIKDNVSVLFKKQDGREVTIEGNVVDGKLYRAGTVVRCDCNRSDPVAYEYDSVSDTFTCPACGCSSEPVSYNHECDVQLYYIGVDYNTMQDLYKLSDTLPYNIWLKVSKYFVKLNPVDVDLDYPLQYVGWVTTVPNVVEDLLDVPLEKRVVNRDVLKELEERVKPVSVGGVVDFDKYFDYVDKLHEVFSVVETPYGAFTLRGEVIPNPLYPPNDYGRGEYWVIEESDGNDSCIWNVHLNHQEGDNLHMNNVVVDGKLGGIGKRIGYDENVVELLLLLKK